MVKRLVKFSCGHEEEMEFFGEETKENEELIEKRVKYYEEKGLCKDCYREEKRRAYAESTGKPIPDEISGKYWNGKVYGKPDSKVIYIEGQQIPVSDERARELEEWQQGCMNFEFKR